ncbi:MAG: cobalt-precorrin-7 (C(5))-methyltransferase [Cenarchaeum symbiont of Oopsacas minuta]|nr:cobalt-precorrin-7 (C(5))-methyltransferase [Cenarchaeum symbiont of Oopsacas minuta]
MANVFAVGVGPGSPDYITIKVEKIIKSCDIVIGYQYTLDTIRHLLADKEVIEITMTNQEATYQKIKETLADKTLVVPFTGDVNFSESEVIDRLEEIFGKVKLYAGISSVQIAAAKTHVPLDKSRIITMHVTGSIEEKKKELCQALESGMNVILVPRPWPKMPEKQFMPSEIAIYLEKNNIDIKSIKITVFENLTTDKETVFSGHVKDLKGKEFSAMTIMVFNQNHSDSYMNYKWQWEDPNVPA